MLFNSRRRSGIDRPGIDDLASLEHSESIREIEHERDMLLHDEHGGSLLAPRQLQHFGNPVNDAWLQALGNFVEQENAGLGDQTSRDDKHLLLTPGKRSGALTKPGRQDGKPRGDFRKTLIETGIAHEPEPEVLANGQILEQGLFLGRISERQPALQV
jgi:hypothetical protein